MIPLTKAGIIKSPHGIEKLPEKRTTEQVSSAVNRFAHTQKVKTCSKCGKKGKWILRRGLRAGFLCPEHVTSVREDRAKGIFK